MYPLEMFEYINSRNQQLNKEETKYITDITKHFQLNHISFNCWDNSYDMWDREGNHYHFIVKE